MNSVAIFGEITMASPYKHINDLAKAHSDAAKAYNSNAEDANVSPAFPATSSSTKMDQVAMPSFKSTPEFANSATETMHSYISSLSSATQAQKNILEQVSSDYRSGSNKNLCVDLNMQLQKPGHRRLPCKARGVPEDHNALTAYFDIPPDAEHGMLLICSHSCCSESGRRFKYCADCKIPVAKRNFLKRHSHGRGKDYSDKNNPGSPSSTVVNEKDHHGDISNINEISSVSGKKRPRTEDGEEDHDDDADSWNSESPFGKFLEGEEVQSDKNIDSQSQPPVPAITIVPLDSSSEPRVCLPVGSPNHISCKPVVEMRQQMLPQGKSCLSPVSLRGTKNIEELSAPMLPSTTTAAGPATTVTMQLTQREIEWLKLLHNRPGTNQTDLMHRWMELVLNTSEAKGRGAINPRASTTIGGANTNLHLMTSNNQSHFGLQQATSTKSLVTSSSSDPNLGSVVDLASSNQPIENSNNQTEQQKISRMNRRTSDVIRRIRLNSAGELVFQDD